MTFKISQACSVCGGELTKIVYATPHHSFQHDGVSSKSPSLYLNAEMLGGAVLVAGSTKGHCKSHAGIRIGHSLSENSKWCNVMSRLGTILARNGTF
jgi:hypothetical protein